MKLKGTFWTQFSHFVSGKNFVYINETCMLLVSFFTETVFLFCLFLQKYHFVLSFHFWQSNNDFYEFPVQIFSEKEYIFLSLLSNNYSFFVSSLATSRAFGWEKSSGKNIKIIQWIFSPSFLSPVWQHPEPLVERKAV